MLVLGPSLSHNPYHSFGFFSDFGGSDPHQFEDHPFATILHFHIQSSLHLSTRKELSSNSGSPLFWFLLLFFGVYLVPFCPSSLSSLLTLLQAMQFFLLFWVLLKFIFWVQYYPLVFLDLFPCFYFSSCLPLAWLFLSGTYRLNVHKFLTIQSYSGYI